jgi:hypothetical protein
MAAKKKAQEKDRNFQINARQTSMLKQAWDALNNVNAQYQTVLGTIVAGLDVKPEEGWQVVDIEYDLGIIKMHRECEDCD